MKLKDLKELIATGDENTEISELFPPKEIIRSFSNELAASIPVSTAYTSFRHAVNMGDIIGSLCAVKKYYDITKRKGRYLQQTGLLAQYYPGATHETVDADGRMVTLNQRLFDMIKPLVESQEYIESMQVYNGQNVDIDFHVIRGKTNVNLPNGSLQAWLFYAYPDLEYDLTQPWITLPPQRQQIEEVTKGKIIINFTERYRGIQPEYYFLKECSPDLIFAGTEKEHWLFCNQWQLTIPRLEIKDFLELAYALRACRFVLCNQSMIWQICEAMKIPRLLEVCSFAQNCMPFYGKHSYGYFYQTALIYYFKKMYNELK